ncbi:hypothetical protein B0H10DRAFT_1278703 [Mycena sp. CBHHK59/15]|nr:hypothetical protein B0H10DRAFT_1278703 [Mycena sp. CBHHK59/15]
MNPSTLVTCKGVADMAIATTLMLKPAILYESLATRGLSSLTGLHISNAAVAPGFNHSIACLVASVGLGNIVAAKCGPAALPPIFAMTSAWSIFSILTCILTPQSWGLSSATLLMGGLVNALFSLTLYVSEPRLFKSRH